MPDPVPAAPAAAAAAVTPAPTASRTGMEAALHLLNGLGGQPATPAAPAPVPAAAPAGTPAAAPPPAAKPPDLDPIARANANAVRREREILDAQRALKAERATLAKEREQVQSQIAGIQAQLKAASDAEAQRASRRALYARDPRLALEDTGISYEHLTQAILNDGAANPELLARAAEERIQAVSEATQKQLEELKAAQVEERKRAEEASRQAQATEREQALAYIRSDIKTVLDANPDEFELIAHFDQSGLVLKAMEQHYQETGQELSPMDAAKKVETYLVAETERAMGTKRFASRVKPKEAPAAAAAGTPAAPAPITLGNLPPAPVVATPKAAQQPDWAAAVSVVQNMKR